LHDCVELQPRKIHSGETITTEKVSEIALSSHLINDDSLTALKSIPDNSIDFCFADPPYNLKKKYDNGMMAWNLLSISSGVMNGFQNFTEF
jgi:DNA modification methylase